MNTYLSDPRRLRALALCVGLLLGAVAGTFAPSLSHAASAIKASRAVIKDAQADRPMDVPEATADQLQALNRVLVGSYDCEFGKHIQVTPSQANPGYVSLRFDKQAWLMKPVQSSTGAIRLEDVQGQTLLVQVMTKSMLLDVKGGHRIVDACMADQQRKAEADLQNQPPQAALLDAPR